MNKDIRQDFYELNTDEFYAYGSTNEDWAYMRFQVTLRDLVNHELLQDSLTLMYERFPYFKVMLSIEKDPERYVLRSNPLSAVVIESDEYISIGDPVLNGHLISVSYCKNSLKILIFHLLTDGVGAKEILQAIMVSYFRMRYEQKSINELRQDISDSEIEKEYGNPLSNIAKPESRLDIKQRESFCFAKEDVDDSRKRTICFSVPQEPVILLAKESETSVAAVFSWFIMHMIFEVSRTEMPVTVAVPLDARRHIGCFETKRNCNTTIYLSMTSGFASIDRARQLTAIRAQMYLQADEENVVPKMFDSRMDWLEASKKKTVCDRIEYYHADDNLAAYPIVTYIGNFDLGDYERYYERMDWFVPVSGQAGVLAAVVCNKGMFNLRITLNLKDSDIYIKTLLNIIEYNGIRVIKGGR